MRWTIVPITLLCILLSSCSKDSNPVEPSSSATLIGEIGSQRTYSITERWFKPSTDTPLVTVPESLLSRITLSDSLRRLGVVEIKQEVESVKEFDTSYYNGWHLPLSRSFYKMTEGVGPSYNLYDELGELIAHRTYTTSTAYTWSAWFENASQVQNVLPRDYWAISPPLPWLKKPLQVSDTWIRYQFIDTSSGTLRDQISAKVLGQVDVTTKAGTFRAIKLVLFSLGGSPPELSNEFEYYVPNVGLVLYEVDRYICRATILPNGGGSMTICFRQVIRKELTSYNILL